MTHRLGKTMKPFAVSDRLTISTLNPRYDLFTAAKYRPLIATISIELHQKWKHAKHRRHDQGSAVTILNVGGVHDGMNQQALRIDEDVTFLALDLLARDLGEPPMWTTENRGHYDRGVVALSGRFDGRRMAPWLNL